MAGAFKNTAISVKVLQPVTGDDGDFYWGMIRSVAAKDLFKISPVAKNTSIGQLKQMIAKERDYPVEKQRIMFFGESVPDSRKLVDCGLTNTDDPLLHMIPHQDVDGRGNMPSRATCIAVPAQVAPAKSDGKHESEASSATASDSPRYDLEIALHDDKKLGVTLDATLAITSILPDGLIEEYNSANPEKALKTGDRFIELNGHTVSTKAEFGTSYKNHQVMKANIQRHT